MRILIHPILGESIKTQKQIACFEEGWCATPLALPFVCVGLWEVGELN